ncbi:Di-copper centre-containing protein [Penicillium maclennaniae]|uniref:Di-copper centre-containing protein n=1 Tax=Penicillium maclennaniae TaxID=1343394 RepID=UPI002542638F|nr:Di-copper centre-containing protein [Penicillium maclennaniae]KAJ5662243.1 Di-copper centre-containing protein [Penicillium maclennaniae]
MFGHHFLALGLILMQTWAMPNVLRKVGQGDSPPLVLPTAASTSNAIAASQMDYLARVALGAATDHIARHQQKGCTKQNLRLERPATLVAGAKTRYDDFVATHINQTLEIHFTGTFLAWHRYFIYGFEQALRDECAYAGDYPYWDWSADIEHIEQSPVFDGTDTSMSGNGVHIANEADIPLKLDSYPALIVPAGTGGGCVTSGPFKDYTVNLGPAALVLPGGNRYNNYTAVANLILQNHDIWDFEMTMQGVPGSGSLGVHGGGHYSMGGDPGRDVYVSPGDPAFWHHHGMIDRVWWIWQNLDVENRLNAISGTGTFLNQPPLANTTLETFVDLGFANGAPVQMKEIMSTTAGPFCYVYV